MFYNLKKKKIVHQNLFCNFTHILQYKPRVTLTHVSHLLQQNFIIILKNWGVMFKLHYFILH